jgi:hypothetical protein
MGFHFYDENMVEMDAPEWIEIDWNRKFYEPGTWMLYTEQGKLDPNIRFIKQDGRPEIAVVGKWSKQKKTEGDMITTSGFFFEKFLDSAIHLSPEYTTSETTISDISNFLNREGMNPFYKLKAPFGIVFEDARFDKAKTFGPMAYELGAPAGTFLYSLLKTRSCSFMLTPEIHDGVYSTFKLIDDKSLVNPAREIWFRQNLGSVSGVDFAIDQTAEYDNYFVTQEVPEGFGSDPFVVGRFQQADGTVKYYIFENYVGSKSMFGIKPIKWIDANISGIEITAANEAKIRAAMQQAALLDMLNQREVQTIDASVIQNEYIYLKDYDIGNFIHIADDYSRDDERWNDFLKEHLGSELKSQIVEISEVHKNNTMDVTVTLGDTKRASGNII